VQGKLVFIMGGGKFGTNALRFLKDKGAKVLLVDVNPNCKASSEAELFETDLDFIDSLGEGQAAFLIGDAVAFLMALLEVRVPDIVVTAIPGNAIAKVVESWLEKRGYKLQPYLEILPKVLENIPESLVSLVDYVCGIIVVSYMPSNMRCRENCVPPKDVCPSTGRPKIGSIFKLLKFSVYNLTDVSGLLYSSQVTGGLGAIEGKELNSLLKRLANSQKSCTYAIGTACDCHGILNLFKVKK
jgi:hypothetical protein